MQVGAISEQYRCLVEILSCLVCKQRVSQAHSCPNCSKFYCLDCIGRQLDLQQKCLNCNRFLSSSMLTNCQKLCSDLTQTLQKVKLRGNHSSRSHHDKSPYYCYRHKLQKSYYCLTCHKPLCSDCSVLTNTHRGHEFIKLSLIKAQFKQNISQHLEEINNVTQNVQRRMEQLQSRGQQKEQVEEETIRKVEQSMKLLRDQIRRKLKKILNEGEKKLNDYNQTIQKWSDVYQKGMKVLKNTPPGKFVEQQYALLERQLLSMLEEVKDLEKSVEKTSDQLQKDKKVVNYISPGYYSFVFVVENFSQKKKNTGFFYTESVTTKEGLQLRLKIYPKGIPEPEDEDESQKSELKLTKRQSKNEDYLAVYIQLVSAPGGNTKQAHEIVLKPQIKDGRQFVREFESQFDVGLCWGYDHYIKLSQLYEEGYYNRELDFIEINLKIGPCSYYQATKDQQALIQQKQQHIAQKQSKVAQLERLQSHKQLFSTGLALSETCFQV